MYFFWANLGRLEEGVLTYPLDDVQVLVEASSAPIIISSICPTSVK